MMSDVEVQAETAVPLANGATTPKKRAPRKAKVKVAAPKEAVEEKEKKKTAAPKKAVKVKGKKKVAKAKGKKEGTKRGPRVADDATFKVVSKKEYRDGSIKGQMWAALSGCKTVGEAKKKMAKYEAKEGRAAATFQMWSKQGDVKVTA